MSFKRPILLSLVVMALFVAQPSQAAPGSARLLLGMPLPANMSQGIIDDAGITSEQQAKMQQIGEKPPAMPALQAPPPNIGAAFLANTVNESELRDYFTWLEKNTAGQAQMADTLLRIRGVLAPDQRDKVFSYVKTHPLPPMPKQIQSQQKNQKNSLESQIDDLLAGISLSPPQAQKLNHLKAAFNKPDNLDPNEFPLAIASLVKTGDKAAFMEAAKTVTKPLPVNELVQGIMSLDHAQRVKIAAQFEKQVVQAGKKEGTQK